MYLLFFFFLILFSDYCCIILEKIEPVRVRSLPPNKKRLKQTKTTIATKNAEWINLFEDNCENLDVEWVRILYTHTDEMTHLMEWCRTQYEYPDLDTIITKYAKVKQMQFILALHMNSMLIHYCYIIYLLCV